MFEKQQIAFDKFSKLKVGALFMKMGTGKTRVAIELVNYNNVDFCLYITPFSTKANICEEISKWGLNCEYEVVGYETIQSSGIKFLELTRKLKNKRCFIIADESIFIKNEDTKRFNRLCQLRDMCEYALILNGTPITKSEWDLYNQMYFLSPLIINMNREQFLNTFFKKITYKKKGHNEKTFYKFSEVNAELLKKLIEPYTFYCDLEFNKDEQLNVEWIDCDYNEYLVEKEKSLQEYIKYGSSDIIINMLTKLNKISADAIEKNDKLCDFIGGRKVIVFCDFLSEVEYIKTKIDCYVITGETKCRDEIINGFEKDNKPLIMTLGVGAYSLNLQFCNEMIFSSLNFDYSKVEQAKYRIKRIGQESDIKYTYFLSNFGINKMILDNLKRKSVLENLIKIKLTKGDLEWIKNL